jgi:ATP-dependent helicase/nuclease subunit A
VLDVIRQARSEARRNASPCWSGRAAISTRSSPKSAAAPRNLRFQAVDIEGLDGRQHVQDLLTLFRALHHRADRVHWLALLRAPWCGLMLADLHALAADDKQSTLWQLMHDESASPASRTTAGNACCMCARCWRWPSPSIAARQHPRRWLEGVWLMLGGPRCLEAPEALADVEAFFHLVDKLAPRAI